MPFQKAHKSLCKWDNHKTAENCTRRTETCTSDMISKYFRTCRDYEQAYREGCLGKDVEVRVKVYKSHRKVTNDSS